MVKRKKEDERMSGERGDLIETEKPTKISEECAPDFKRTHTKKRKKIEKD